jgi:hypothetical protein
MNGEPPSSDRVVPQPTGQILALCAIVLVQTVRVAGLDVAQQSLDGSAPAWLFPALADTAFGLTAPFIALALWRRTGLAVWALGLVWLSLSLFDFVNGLASNLAFGPPASLGASADEATFVLLAWIALDVAAIALLVGPALLAHYLERDLS